MLDEVKQDVGITPLAYSFKNYEEAPKHQRPMGWALRSRKKSAPYDKDANDMVTNMFEEYFRAGRKLRADEVDKRMRERERMTHDQIKNRIRTLLAKTKEEQKKNHRNI